MSLGSRLQVAAAKATLKQSLREKLNGLSVEERADILADLLAEIDSTVSDVSDVSSNGVTASAPGAEQKNGRQPARGHRRMRRHDGNKGETIIEMLREKPGRKISEISDAIYNDAGRQAQSKARSLMNSLAKKNLIRRVPGGQPGQWEVTH